MDYREKFTQNVNNDLIKLFSSTDVNAVMNIILSHLGNYEITERTTEVGFVDNSSEKLLELYAGTLLTEGKSKKTVKGYISLLQRFLHDINKNFVEVSTIDIKIWLAQQQQHVSLRTCDIYRSYLSAFYTWIFNEEYIKKNPMAKIKPIKYIKKIEKSFSDVELDTLRLTCDNTRNRAILEFLLSSGVRIAELCSLTIHDINFEKNSVLVKEGKGGKSRIVFINDVTVSYLKKYLKTRKDNDPHLFITRNKNPLSPDTARLMMKTLENISGVQDIHPHRFRHTFATTMHKKGMDIHTIQKLMGHTDINTTMTYIDDDDEIISIEYRKFT